MIDLSIVVLHFERWDLTKDCLASIDAQEIPCSYEKVLVDNGSTNLLPTLPEGWRLARYHIPRGHIVGQNRCFESARGEWVLFVANDVRIRPYGIESLWILRQEFSVSQPCLLAQNGAIDNLGLRWYWPGYGMSVKHVGVPADAFSGSCYLMRKECWRSVGGFDEALHSSHEDIDFSLKMKTHTRWNIISVPVSVATHLGNATLRHQPSHNRAAFHRDRVYLIRKHYTGLNRLLRLACVYLLDSIPRP